MDHATPFVVEFDASDLAISAMLSQASHPVVFMSRTLSGNELHYLLLEKEATEIIEAVQKWSHLLQGQQSIFIIDQWSVAFMLDTHKRTKIKNDKFQGWRLDLAYFSYPIWFWPGKNSVATDTLPRLFCGSVSSWSLKDIPERMCLQRVVRMLHFVWTKNSPFSTEYVKKICATCWTFVEAKPLFHRLTENILIKALIKADGKNKHQFQWSSSIAYN